MLNLQIYPRNYFGNALEKGKADCQRFWPSNLNGPRRGARARSRPGQQAARDGEPTRTPAPFVENP